jgi:glycosyltransferase involved in cell wall biosynthesis
VFSLEGERAELVSAWSALEVIQGRLTGFGWQGGLNPALVGRIRDALRAHDVDSVVLHHIGPYLYGGIAARLAGIASIAHVEHDAWHLDATRRRFLTRVLESVVRPRHVAVCDEVAAQLSRIVPRAAIRVIANGIDLDRFVPGDRQAARAALALTGAARVVGSIGRLQTVKGHDLLIRAMTTVPDDVVLVIAGAGPAAGDLVQLTRELGLEDRVRFLGHRDDVQQVLCSFDVFCLPSRSEGLPRSVIEAQACGIPVIATDVGALREAVCPASGRIVPPEDVPALAAALRTMLAQPSLASPRTFVAEKFEWRRTQSAYLDVTESRHAA